MSGIKGSAEYFELYCQPCENDGEHREAIGYCTVCQEYFCDTCIKYHMRFAKTKSHQILSGNDLSKVKEAPLSSKDALTEVCPIHTEEVIKYFCNNHHILACGVCIPLHHRTCRDVSYIPDISSSINEDPELIHVKADLYQIRNDMSRHGEEAKLHSNKAINMHGSATAEIEDIRKQINEYLDRMEVTVRSKIDAIKNEEVQKFEIEENKFRTMVNKLDDFVNTLDEKKQKCKNNGLFIAMKQAKEKVSVMKGDVEQQAANLGKPTSYSIEKDRILQKVKADLAKIWDVTIRSDKTTTVSRLADLDAKCILDKKDCCITGVVVLPDQRLAVTDMENNTVKLIDPDKNRLTIGAILSSSPYDIALVKGKELAVILGKENKVQMIGVSKGLTSLKSFPVPGKCRGVECYDDKLFIVSQSDSRIYVMDLHGIKLQEISGDWSLISRITLNKYGEIFVTDHKGHTVLHMDSDGRELSRFTSETLKLPVGIANDPCSDCIYVVSWGASKVLQLSSSGQFMRTLLTDQHGLQHPVAITCKDQRLYVSFDGKTSISNKLGVFELK